VEIKQTLTPTGKVSLKQPVTIKKIPPTYMENAVAIESLELLATQLSLNASPVDVESIYNSFCKIIDEPFGPPAVSKEPWGTLEITGVESEDTPLTTTLC